MEKRNVIRLISSLIIAVALWVYVINVVNPSSTTTVRNIPVTLEGTDVLYGNNLAIDGTGKYTVDITVRATRTDLSTLSADNIIATADVSGLTLGQDYITVDVSVPREYTVEDIRSRKILVYVDELERKTVPVVPEFSGTQAGGYEPTLISIDPSYVEIFGAKNQVGRVNEVAVAIDASVLNYEKPSELILSGEAREATSGIALPGVTVSVSEFSVSAAAYSTKKVTLNTSYHGDPWAGVSINKITVPDSITIKGSSEALASVSEINSEEIDIEGIYEDTSIGITPILPAGIYVSDNDASLQLVVDLADTGSIDFHYYPYDIVANGLPENLEVDYSLSIESYITATVTGPVTTLKTMSSEDIVLSVDGARLTSTTKSAKVTASTQVTGVNISLSPATVSVNVREKEKTWESISEQTASAVKPT